MKMVNLGMKLYASDLTPSALGKWIKQHQNTGTFNHQDNLSDEEKS